MIEQQRAHFESGAPIVAPVIKIERERLESSTRKVHEYVLPLDAAWEFPRENLKLGKVSKKHMYSVTHHIVQNLLLTSKQKFRFGLARPSRARTKQNFSLKSTGGFALF